MSVATLKRCLCIQCITNCNFRGIFTNSETGQIKNVGETVAFPTLAETYRKIAKEGVDTFYNGSLRDDIIADLEELGNLDLIILSPIIIMFMFMFTFSNPKTGSTTGNIVVGAVVDTGGDTAGNMAGNTDGNTADNTVGDMAVDTTGYMSVNHL